MSTLDKISEALRNLDSDSPVAEALAAIVGTEKADSALPLVDAAGKRMADAFNAMNSGKSIDDVRPLLKSAASLLLVASGDHAADYRTMSKAEFEEFAAGEIAKAAEAGIEGGQLDSLRTSIDVANVLFKGDNAARRFTLPLPIVAKAAPAEEEEAPAADAGGEEGADDAATGEAEAAPAAEEPAAEEPAAEAAADEAADESASDDTEKKDEDTDEDGEPVLKSWPIDMSVKGEHDPEWGFDSPAPAAE